MIALLVNLLVFFLIIGLAYWIVTMIPIPAPFAWVVRVIFAIICLIVLIEVLTGALMIPLGHWR